MYDWELATIGEPLADIGWAEATWALPGYVTSVPGAPSADELVARWEELTGIRTEHRPWYRAFQLMKTAAMMVVAGHLYEAGHSNDRRLSEMAASEPFLTQLGLRELGIEAPSA